MRLIASLLITLLASSTFAADIRVLSAGAIKPSLVEVVAAFEKETGHKVRLENDTAGALARRVEAGEKFDVVIVTAAGLKNLVASGKLEGASAMAVARCGIGVAVKEGAALPKIATVDEFRATLLSARAIAHIDPNAGGSSGIYLTKLFDTWGIADRIRAKAVLVPGGLTAQRLLTGEADIALQQLSELLVVPGAQYVGPIPAEIQHYTEYSAGVSTGSTEPLAARAFLASMKTEAAKSIMRKGGLEP
jgi:molybdate transport system substrate-binding protein